MLPLAALGLVLAAWGAFSLGQYRASQLDMSRFGGCVEVYEALACDGYRARVQLPYFTAALVLDGLATAALIAAGTAGQFRVLAVLAGLFLVPTGALHGLGWFLALLFAS
jgi:hypothetical protein